MPAGLRILHILRAPTGGLFRHVRDLVRGQSKAGHAVGVICDSQTGGDRADAALAELAPRCSLGVARTRMARLPGLGDVTAAMELARVSGSLRPDILHGHGAKGGLYARLAAKRLGVKGLYTPHGGSLHYEWRQPQGALFLGTERMLRALTSGFLFVCDYEKRAFARKVGLGQVPSRVVYNGLWPDEFTIIPPLTDATELIFIGELRHLKGVADLLEATALLNKTRKVSLTITGDGPDRAEFEARANALSLGSVVRFTGALPARQAFGLGRLFVMPSHAESFPYVLLEAVAAGLPVIASRVGGIPEVLPAADMVPPRDPAALASAIMERLDHHEPARASAAIQRPAFRDRFAAEKMCADITDFYRTILAA
ncbi:MAG: glycosyltransferase [Rhizobiales bacterium]|nr:glycosyltransferase [Hyphomicrobiales bacterium]